MQPRLLPFLDLIMGLLALETAVGAHDGIVVLARTAKELNAAISDPTIGHIVVESGLEYAMVPEYTEETKMVSPRQITRNLTISADGLAALSFLGKPGVLLVADGASLTLVNLTLTGTASVSEITPEDNIKIASPLLVVWPSVLLEPETTITFDNGILYHMLPTCGVKDNDTRVTFEKVFGKENLVVVPGLGYKVVGLFTVKAPVLEYPTDEPMGTCTIVGINVTWRCVGSQQVTEIKLAAGQVVPLTIENYTRPNGQLDFAKDKPQLVRQDIAEHAPALAPVAAIGSSTAQGGSEENSSGNDGGGGSVPWWVWVVGTPALVVPVALLALLAFGLRRRRVYVKRRGSGSGGGMIGSGQEADPDDAPGVFSTLLSSIVGSSSAATVVDAGSIAMVTPPTPRSSDNAWAAIPAGQRMSAASASAGTATASVASSAAVAEVDGVLAIRQGLLQSTLMQRAENLWAVRPEGVQIMHCIGIGSYARVYKGYWGKTPVAIKVAPVPVRYTSLDNSPDAGAAPGCRGESLEVCTAASHPNIVTIYRIWTEAGKHSGCASSATVAESEGTDGTVHGIPASESSEQGRPGRQKKYVLMEYCDRGTLLDAQRTGQFLLIQGGGGGGTSATASASTTAQSSDTSRQTDALAAHSAATSSNETFITAESCHVTGTTAAAAAAAVGPGSTVAAASSSGGSRQGDSAADCHDGVTPLGVSGAHASGSGNDSGGNGSRSSAGATAASVGGLGGDDAGELDLLCILRCLEDIAAGMEYLHRQGIVHGDLKPANVLLRSTRSDSRGYMCKIADFGLSRFLAPESSAVYTQTLGTVAYMPPELLSRGRLTPAVDVFSWAIIAWEMLSGCQLHQGLGVGQVYYSTVVQGYRPELTLQGRDCCPPGLADLVNSAWQPNPDARPDFVEVLSQLRELITQAARR